ncbi:MAG: SH3 domain-containing protein [Bacteroidia bacterium]|nr:SH3 domain-containing protein [Bacteroidia bacterium]
MHRILLPLAALLLLVSAGCGDESASGTASSPAAAQPQTAVALWEPIGLRDKPGKGSDAKYLTGINFGEVVTLTGQRHTDSADGGKAYLQVTLADGKTGWAQENLFAAGAQRAVALAEADLFKRPELTTLSGVKLAPGEVFAFTTGEQADWLEVVTREKKKKGWIRRDGSISLEDADVAIGILLDRALREKDPKKRSDALGLITSNSAFASSPLMALATEQAAASNLPELPASQLYILSDKVNVRSEPNADADNVVFQLKYGDICNIVEQGAQEQIRDMNDYWYRIEKDGQEGWVYGFYTSKKL